MIDLNNMIFYYIFNYIFCMHNNTTNVNVFQFKYIDYMSIRMGSVYKVHQEDQ